MKVEWKTIEKIALFLKETFGEPPFAAVVLGSGLKDSVSDFCNGKSLQFSDVPNWPQSTVKGHSGMLHMGKIAEKKMLFQLGRVHLYEGYCVSEVVLPVRALVKWGVKKIIFTNAAGGINEQLKTGQLMVISDHINFTGKNPLVGPNNADWGIRFPDMSRAYCPIMKNIMQKESTRLKIDSFTGVYAGLLGPSYETPAEVSMLRTLGADAVGMSTVLEVIAALHMGAKVAGVSCISNTAASSAGAALSHDDVAIAAKAASVNLSKLIESSLPKWID